MMDVTTRLVLMVLYLLSPCLVLAANPIVPESVLSAEEISAIEANQDYFFYHSLDQETPIWKRTHRQYSSHFLGVRTHFVNEEEVLHRVLTDGFNIRYKLEQLYRAKLGVQVAVGDVLPRLDLTFGAGAAPLNLNRAFAGLFGFVLPANWLRLANQKLLYRATKYVLMRTVLDEMLNARLLYIRQHQLIQEFEILNYYFIHLQLLARHYPEGNRAIDTIMGKFAYEGTKMATQRGDTKLGFDDLAHFMALEKIEGRYGAEKLNIADIEYFPRRVKDLDELEPIYRNKELFLEAVVRHSVELKAVKIFYEMSKLNIGITATGGTLAPIERPGNPENDARFALRFGYGTIPTILVAASSSRTARIDVEREYLQMLDNARRSFDFYTNSLGGYTEARRSLAINRKAFIGNLQYLLSREREPDSLFVLSLNQLIGTELKLNNALHGSLRARAYMDRFLLIDRSGALQYLPKRDKILEVFSDIHSHSLDIAEHNEILDVHMQEVHRASKLRRLLYEPLSIAGLEAYSDADIEAGVTRNLGSLLHSRLERSKSQRYYQVLGEYIGERHIELTASERYTLTKHSASLWARIFHHKEVFRGDYRHNFDFKHFTVEHP